MNSSVMMKRLYHVSDNGFIKQFEPRTPPSFEAGITEQVVWAIDEQHLVNYLLPRDCPRVTFYPAERSTPEDIKKFLGPNEKNHVIAIEEGWFRRAIESVIWLYELPEETFEAADQGAGYFISKQAVLPRDKKKIANPLLELVSRGAELRVVSSLWPLRDSIITSTLQYSMIRMRNAKPRITKTPIEAPTG